MKHTDIRKAFAPALYDVLAEGDKLPKPLRPYQSEALTKIADWASDPSGSKRSYLHHATGLGKTITFATIVRAAMKELRSLIITPSRPLLVQTVRTVAKYTHGIIGHLSSVGNVADCDGEIIAVRGLDHSSVVIVTDASFNKFAQQILAEFDPHIILRDECHWGYTDEAIYALDRFEEAVIIGFSATPDHLTNRAKGGYTPVTLENGQTLYGPRAKFADTHFQTCLDRRSLRWGIEEGWLAPLAWGMIDFEQVHLQDIPIVSGEYGSDYDRSKLQQMLEEHWPVMCETIRRLYENGEMGLHERQVYAVCPSVKAAQQLSDVIASLGLSTACVTGDTHSVERDIIFDAYRAKEIGFLASVKVLREGWDDPNAEVCMMLTPTASYQYYMQPLGRCVRVPDDGSPKTALVLDPHFRGKLFSPLSAPALFAPPGSEVPIGSVLIHGGGGGWCKGASQDSPLLPKQAKPKIIVLDFAELQENGKDIAGQDGTIEADGERWATIETAHRITSIHRSALRARIQENASSIRSLKGLDLVGHRRTFYSIRDIELAFRKELRQNARRIGVTEDERFLSEDDLARRLGIGRDSLRKLLKKHHVAPTLRKSRSGQRVKSFSFQKAQAACTALIAIPFVKENGTLKSSGLLWVSRTALREGTGLNRTQVNYLLSRKDVRYLEARALIGKKIHVYAFPDIQRHCLRQYKRSLQSADITSLQQKRKKNQAGMDGTFTVDGVQYIGVYTYSIMKGIHQSSVIAHMRGARLRQEQGYTRLGMKRPFYALEDLDSACATAFEKATKSRKAP